MISTELARLAPVNQRPRDRLPMTTIDGEEAARARYEMALLEFELAGRVLQDRIDARTIPTTGEIRREENARAELVSARRALQALHALSNPSRRE